MILGNNGTDHVLLELQGKTIPKVNSELHLGHFIGNYSGVENDVDYT